MSGWKVTIDHWYEIMLIGLILIACIGAVVSGIKGVVIAVLGYLGRGGRMKVGPMEAGSDATKPLHTTCEPYVEEHSAILHQLSLSIAELTKIAHLQAIEMRALYAIQGPQLDSHIVLLEAVKGSVMNGNVDKALALVREAQRKFDEALLARIGGGGNVQ